MNNKLIILKVFALILIQNFETTNSIIINTKSGPINGLSVTFNNKTINKFHGIPYAEPPVGVNRFDKPKPVHQWNSTYDATKFRNSCYQKSSPHNMSEDCLYLDIYSEERKAGDNKLQPVMFWIHGGGLTMGDGYDQDMFDGTVLSSNGVVVVSINYRLGPFGFLYGNDSTAPGNVGILDQIMALNWVKDNIALFGGDPEQVTIFGFSAGSWSVSTLIVSPLTKNLFKRAIMQSGAYYDKPNMNSDKATHLTHSKNMAKSLGCNLENKWLDCLRNASAENIQSHNAVEAALTYGDEGGVVPLGVEEALKQKKVNTDIELMAGTTNNEAFGWAVGGYPDIANTSIHITKDELKVKILSIFKNLKNPESVYDYYISHLNESDQIGLRRGFSAIYTDLILLCPTYFFAEEYAQISDKTYFYVNTYKSKYSGCKDWAGVCHGDDMAFIFGHPITQKLQYNETDYKFSLMLTQIWTDFAKTGNPLSHSVTNTLGTEVKIWPKFIEEKSSPITPKVMELNPIKFGNVLDNPYHGNCDLVMKPNFV